MPRGGRGCLLAAAKAARRGVVKREAIHTRELGRHSIFLPLTCLGSDGFCSSM